jgi:hypothetical protein
MPTNPNFAVFRRCKLLEIKKHKKKDVPGGTSIGNSIVGLRNEVTVRYLIDDGVNILKVTN